MSNSTSVNSLVHKFRCEIRFISSVNHDWAIIAGHEKIIKKVLTGAFFAVLGLKFVNWFQGINGSAFSQVEVIGRLIWIFPGN